MKVQDVLHLLSLILIDDRIMTHLAISEIFMKTDFWNILKLITFLFTFYEKLLNDSTNKQINT